MRINHGALLLLSGSAIALVVASRGQISEYPNVILTDFPCIVHVRINNSSGYSDALRGSFNL